MEKKITCLKLPSQQVRKPRFNQGSYAVESIHSNSAIPLSENIHYLPISHRVKSKSPECLNRSHISLVYFRKTRSVPLQGLPAVPPPGALFFHIHVWLAHLPSLFHNRALPIFSLCFFPLHLHCTSYIYTVCFCLFPLPLPHLNCNLHEARTLSSFRSCLSSA